MRGQECVASGVSSPHWIGTSRSSELAQKPCVMLASTGPTSGQVPSTSPRIRSYLDPVLLCSIHVPERGPCEFSKCIPRFAQLVLTKCGANLANFGLNWAGNGRTWSDFDQIWPVSARPDVITQLGTETNRRLHAHGAPAE